MKIRNGFVSNSSSSSYIIAVRKDITEFELAEVYREFIEPNIPKDLEDMYGEEVHFDVFSRILDLHPNITIEGWNINNGWSCDYFEEELNFLNYVSKIDSEKFKSRRI